MSQLVPSGGLCLVTDKTKKKTLVKLELCPPTAARLKNEKGMPNIRGPRCPIISGFLMFCLSLARPFSACAWSLFLAWPRYCEVSDSITKVPLLL